MKADRYEIIEGPDKEGKYTYFAYWTAYIPEDKFSPNSGKMGTRSQIFKTPLCPEMNAKNTKGFPNERS